MHPDQARPLGAFLQLAHDGSTHAKSTPGRMHADPEQLRPAVRSGPEAAHTNDGRTLFDDDEVPTRLDKIGLDVSQVGERRGWTVWDEQSMGMVGSAVAPMFGTLVNAQSRGVSSLRARRTVSTETTMAALAE